MWMHIDLAVSEERDEKISFELDAKNASISRTVQPLPVVANTSARHLMSEMLVSLSSIRKVVVLPLSGSTNDRACSVPRFIGAAGCCAMTEVFQNESNLRSDVES